MVVWNRGFLANGFNNGECDAMNEWMNECIYFGLKPIERKNAKHTNTYKERQTETDSIQNTDVKQNIGGIIQ